MSPYNGIADTHLAFVPGGQDQVAELVRIGHEQISANPRLQIFLGRVRTTPGEWLR